MCCSVIKVILFLIAMKKVLTNLLRTSIFTSVAEVAELVDALGSGSSVCIDVEVRVFSSAPNLKRVCDRN